MSYGTDYQKNFEEGMECVPVRTRVKMSKITTSIAREENNSIAEIQGDKNDEENNHKKLRESVLNKLWDSLPPETQILTQSEDEDSNSDATESGLDGEEEEEEANSVESPKLSTEKNEKFSSSKNEEMQNKSQANYKKINNSQAKSNPENEEDPTSSWDINFDFIQAIIWLKSTTEKLQRVPADEFLRAFKNQWELSPIIKSSESGNDLIENVDALTTTKQREQLDLIRNRLAGCNIFREIQRDVVIPETDESGASSLQSSQFMPEKPATIDVTVSDSMGNSTVDSGFNSEKPESAEATDLGFISENTEATGKLKNDRLKLLASRSSGSETGRRNPFREFRSVKTVGRIAVKRKRGAVLKTRTAKRPRLSISSATLNYVLRSSECNKLLVNSVGTILKVLENERNGFNSVRINWRGSVQKEAIDAIVTVVDQLEKEKGSNLCRNEAVLTVKRVLEKILHSNDVDKQKIWEHHRLVILELCNSSSVCTEVVNYLITELEKLILVAKQTNEKTMRRCADVMDKSYVLFHSLKVALIKYKSFPPSPVTTNEANASQKILEVTDLWKRNWKVNEKEHDVFVTGLETLESPVDTKEVWIRVLEELVVASTTVWPLVKVLAWQCLAVLKVTDRQCST